MQKLSLLFFDIFLAPSELLKWRCPSVGRSVCWSVTSSFLAAFSACSGSFQPSLVWSRLVQTNLVYSSQIQSNLIKSSQIQINLFQAIFGDIFGCIRLFIGSLWSGLYQCRPIQSTLVKSSQILSNLVKSRKIFSGLLLAAYIAYSGFLQSSLVQTRQVKTNLVYSSKSQSNLVKSR